MLYIQARQEAPATKADLLMAGFSVRDIDAHANATAQRVRDWLRQAPS